MRTILGDEFPDLEIVTLADFEDAPEPEETGTTYEENAIIKAESAAQFTGEWCVADDAGLEIDALDGEPGLYSKRFAGEDTSFPEKMAIILNRMESVPIAERGARFRCLVALAKVGDVTQVFEGVLEGKISHQPSGEYGFGYDPIFWVDERDCTLATLTPEEKHEISHRGKVLRKLSEAIRRLS